MKWLLLAFVVVGFSGCADSVNYTISGSFTADRTSADLAAFDAKVLALGGEAVIMESFPEQFRVTFSNKADCDAMHHWAHTKSFIDQSKDNHCVLA